MARLTFHSDQIRWIAFDAVGTLIRPDPPVAAVYHAVAARHGSRLDAQEIRTRFQEAFARLETDECPRCDCRQSADVFHTCEKREGLRWRQIVESVLDDVSFPQSCFMELFTHFSRPTSWCCFADAPPALIALKEAGFRLAVCSNFDARLHSVMDGIVELRPIQLRIISSLVGHRKPSAQFFGALLQAAECTAAEVLFVGDNLRNDIVAAESAGIVALQIDRTNGGGDNWSIRSLAEIPTLLRA
jgi:putative hydrolase of the HAD superfamily